MIVGLVLVSAFLHALWNALLRLEADKDRALVGAIGVASAFALIIAGVRWGVDGVAPFPNLASVAFTVVAGLGEAMYFTTLARALTVGRLGTVYTVSRGGAVLVVWPASIALYGELLDRSSAIGSGVVLAGLILCGLGARSAAGGRDARAGLGWAIACAASIASYHLAYKAALRAGAATSACFAASLALSWIVSAVRLGGAGRSVVAALVRTRWPRIVLMGIVCSGSFLILMEALHHGGSGRVLTLRNTSVLFAALLSTMIGERPSRAEIGGSALVALGAFLMR